MGNQFLIPEKITDSKPLHRLIARGDLDALREYIHSGHPLRVKYGQLKRLKSALEFAVQQRFYSQVKLLLEEVEWEDVERRWCLDYAIGKGRGDLVRLLLQHGASASGISARKILRTVNMEIIEEFLERGMDPCEDNAFARVLEATKAKPLLRFYRKYQDRFPCLRPQLSQSLAIALIHENARWISLLIWAGADLDLEVKVPLSGDYDESYPEICRTTPRDEMKGVTSPPVLKLLNIPESDEIRRMRLASAALKPEKQGFRELMKRASVGDLNSGYRGGCDALAFLVDENCHDLSQHISYMDGRKEQRETLERVGILLKAGARWRPSKEKIKVTRRDLITHDGEYFVKLLDLLISVPEAVVVEDLWELCRTPAIRKKLIEADPKFWKRICRSVAKAGHRGAANVLSRFLRTQQEEWILPF